jgi:bifunctional DNA-binding transcriptional regulator/antitoxin component of YhaV-PrlF toxin-antitoxin module
MDDRRQHLGIARVREIEGLLVLVFPRRVIRLFDLKPGDTVEIRKRRGRKQYLVTFWRGEKRLSLLHPDPARPRKDRS